MSVTVQQPPLPLGATHDLPLLADSRSPAHSSAVSLSLAVYALAGFAVVLHFAFNGGYGFFRDEIYYAANGQRLAWGYVDHAPLAPFLARLSRWAMGDSIRALRFLPAVSSGLKVLLAGWMAREMGGRKAAQFLAALAVLLTPIYLTFDNFFSMNAFEPVFWMASAAIVLRIVNGGDRRLWLLFGVVAGLGLQNKHSMLFFGSGLAIGLLLTPARREFARIWIWLGSATAFLIFLPNLLWEIHNGWPTIALLHAVVGTKYSTVTPLEYFLQQALLTDPLAAPIWLGGLWFLLFDKVGRKYSVLGWAYLTVLAEMILLHGKIYYLGARLHNALGRRRSVDRTPSDPADRTLFGSRHRHSVDYCGGGRLAVGHARSARRCCREVLPLLGRAIGPRGEYSFGRPAAALRRHVWLAGAGGSRGRGVSVIAGGRPGAGGDLGL